MNISTISGRRPAARIATCCRFRRENSPDIEGENGMTRDDANDIIENLGADAHRFSGKTVLLSGGAGFLGCHFIAVFRKLNQEVLAKPCKVISVDNYITGEQAALHEGDR